MENKFQQELKMWSILVPLLRMLNHLSHPVRFHLHDDSVKKDFLNKTPEVFAFNGTNLTNLIVAIVSILAHLVRYEYQQLIDPMDKDYSLFYCISLHKVDTNSFDCLPDTISGHCNIDEYHYVVHWL